LGQDAVLKPMAARAKTASARPGVYQTFAVTDADLSENFSVKSALLIGVDGK
jgi:hypothetical protein